MRFVTSSHCDLIVLSDLHLGEGMQKDEPRFVPTEDFFHDHQFAHFLDHLIQRYKHNENGVKLVLNGDTFDFLTVTACPNKEEARRRGFEVSIAEQKFGLNPTSKKSIFKLDIIVNGHIPFFSAIARFVTAGFHVEIIRGNHDLELFFSGVKERLYAHLARLSDTLDIDTVKTRVHFHEWFYLEPMRVYIEHGNQYDASNSIRYPLSPLLDSPSHQTEDTEAPLDYPLGSIFVRFFYNRVRILDPYSPRIVSFDHYLSFIKRYNLFDVWRIYKDHYPHFLAALGTDTTTGSAGETDNANVRQQETFSSRAAEFPIPDLYQQLSALKNSPVSASKANVVKEMISAVVRRMRNFGILAFIAIFTWFGILYLIDSVPGLTANAFLMALFAVATLGAALTVWIHLDRKLRRHEGISSGNALVEKSAQIASLTGAKLVLMGHSHMVDYRKLESENGTVIYANSGTWTSIDNPWSRFMRDARRLTFLLVHDDEVYLHRWNDYAYRFDPVPLFQLSKAGPMDKLPSEVAMDVVLTGRVSLPPTPVYSIDDESLSEREDET